MNKKLFFTTPLYYVNDKPHLGHAYTTIAADCLARYHRLQGNQVHLLTGTDEHGDKIAQSAAQNNQPVHTWVDSIAVQFKRMWSLLDISYDDFIRTTEFRHRKVVQSVFTQLLRQGDIYRGTYTGWYCRPCESYWTKTQVYTDEQQNILCPDCRRPVSQLAEDSYFFRLSAYAPQLLDYYRTHPEFIQPSFRVAEIINFVTGKNEPGEPSEETGLKDLSISRTRVPWGIPVPNENVHTIYVWFDALLNYISAAGYHTNDTEFTELWPADCHLVGKEILRFHTVIWPAILIALGLPLPKKVFAHGWWTVEGEKMSKSRGNFISPEEIIVKYNIAALRYYLLREIPFGNDGDFSHTLFQEHYNADLANGLGNLFSRTLTLIEKFCTGMVPATITSETDFFPKVSTEVNQDLNRYLPDLNFQSALQSIWRLVDLGNKYIDEKAPWNLIKTQPEQTYQVLVSLTELLRHLGVYLYPFIPQISLEILSRLGINDIIDVKGNLLKYTYPELIKWDASFLKGNRVRKGTPLFPRVK